MLRLIAARDLYTIFKSSCVSRAATCQVTRVPLPRSCIRAHEAQFFTISNHRKEIPLPNPHVSEDGPDTVDLDKWKTVMKLKAIPEENRQVDDAVDDHDDDDEDDEEEDDTPGTMTLESARELVTMWRLAGRQTPQEITDEELQTLADLTTNSAKKKYLKFLAKREKVKITRKVKQEKKNAERGQRAALKGDEGDGEEKGLKNKSFLLQFWNRSFDNLQGWRCAQAMIYGQPLIFDMSYEGNMSRREVDNTVSQLMEVEGWNRRAADPYHLHFCNMQPDSYCQQQLIKRYGAEVWDRLIITCTEKQHIELFPPEQLVYLTADSPNVLRHYDHNKVYIVGGMVDRKIQSGLSLANAKRLKLATARLPLNEYLHWEVGAKNLTLNQMIRILLSLKETGQWLEALKFVPTRKHRGFHPHHQKEPKPVMNRHEKPVKSSYFSLNDLKLNDAKMRPTFIQPKRLRTRTEHSKRATTFMNWLKDK